MRTSVRQVGWPWLAMVVLSAAPATGLAQSQWLHAAWGTPTPRAPNPAVVRVTAVDGDGTSHGSGTLVAAGPDSGLVITNWHVIRDAVGPITVRFPDGFESAAQVIKTDQDWDLAALRIGRPSARPIPIAHLPPQVGEYLVIAGYGAGTYREARGRVTQYVAPSSKHPYEMIELSAEARNGDSGGPILNGRGELAGVLFGAAQGTTAGSYCGRVRRFLSDVRLHQSGQPSSGLASRPAPAAPATPAAPAAPAPGTTGAPHVVPRGPSARPATEIARGPAAARSSGGGVRPLVPVAPASTPVTSSVPELEAFPQVSLDTPAYQPPPPPRVPSDGGSRPKWTAGNAARYLKILGDTPWEQAKTFLAIVGIVSLVMQFMGRKDD